MKYWLIKEGCADLNKFKWVRQQLFIYLSIYLFIYLFIQQLFIIAQSDTRNIEYLICWLQKISLEKVVFE